MSQCLGPAPPPTDRDRATQSAMHCTQQIREILHSANGVDAVGKSVMTSGGKSLVASCLGPKIQSEALRWEESARHILSGVRLFKSKKHSPKAQRQHTERAKRSAGVRCWDGGLPSCPSTRGARVGGGWSTQSKGTYGLGPGGPGEGPGSAQLLCGSRVVRC